MNIPAAPDLNALTKDFLRSCHVLIVDQNASARVGLKKLLVSLGAQLHQIHTANSYEEAENLIHAHKPKLLLCDYQIEGKFGLDLLQKLRQEHQQESSQCIFILVTSNTSQSAVAQAAEEDVDAYILKPYTIEGFTISLNQAIQVKLQPSEYLQLVQTGKDLLEKDQLDDALSVFKLAINKDGKPSLACFYEGLTHFKKEYLEGSEISYNTGLRFNKIHYKCLVGLFDLLMSLNKYEPAYQIVQRIVRFFPANPKRLSTVLKLAIQTKHYSDINSLYEEFLKIENRSEELTKCVCAALIVCGKHFFEIHDENTAIDLVQKASVSAAGSHFLLRKAIDVLILYDQVNVAQLVLKRFSNPSEEDPQYAVASFLIYSKEANTELVASRGQTLLKNGVNDPDIYRVTIDCFEKLGKKQRAQELRDEMNKIFSKDVAHETREIA
jgi:CheY-like chemotaxis protein